MDATRPRVFVSSTFYDLKQVRDDLRSFIESLGYEALLSEHSSFPVEPSITTIQNCRQRVEQQADVFVLIVGARYGSRDPDSSRSITNIEYLAARAKGIPIYAFLEKRLEPLLELWKANPTVDLSSQIDSSDLLRFVDGIRNNDRVWTSTFDRAGEIVDSLRRQFAFLMVDGLQWRMKLNRRPFDSAVRKLSGQSLRLALERPVGWEYLLLAQVIRDHIVAARHLREEHDEALALGLGEDVEQPIKWPLRRIRELGRIADSLNPIMKTIANRALGPPGQSGDPDEIVFAGRSVGHVYVAALEWSRRVRTANIPEALVEVQRLLARFPEAMVQDIEKYAEQLESTVREALESPAGSPPRQVVVSLNLRFPEGLSEEMNSELERLRAEIENRGGVDW